jgi:hypothetical protein
MDDPPRAEGAPDGSDRLARRKRPLPSFGSPFPVGERVGTGRPGDGPVHAAPARSDVLAAFTIASTSWTVISRTRLMFGMPS